MKECKCSNGFKLCPFSFGVALGVTSAIAVLVWTAWVMYHGATPMMLQYHVPMPSWKDGAWRALCFLLKGFFFGAVLAFVYDFVICCCKGKRSKGECPCCCKPGSAKGK